LEGTVIRSTGSSYSVLLESGEKVLGKLKGNFRIRGIRSTNPVVIGDKVTCEPSSEGSWWWIVEIHPRFNHIIRKSKKLSKESHILAANIDQNIVVIAVASPVTPQGFIDRVLVTSEAYHIPSLLVINKIDLYGKKERESVEKLKRIYGMADYEVLEVSAIEFTNLDMLIDRMANKTSLFTGNSGVGKSALINAMAPGMNLRTGKISAYHQKGIHTTTYAELFVLPFGGFIIDTPGIREFGLIDFKKEEVAERFPEMRKYMHLCQYNNCTHTHEPQCGIRKALENGWISEERYQGYLNILNDDYSKQW